MPTSLATRCTNFLDHANALRNKEGLPGRCAFMAEAYGRKMPPTEWERSTRNDSVIHVNKVHPTVRMATASLYAKRPDILVKPRMPQFEDASSKNEVFLNYLARKYDHANEISLWVTAANLFPYSILKLGMGDGLPTVLWTPTLSFFGDPTMEMFEPEKGRWCAFKHKRTITTLRASKLYDEKLLDKAVVQLMGQFGKEFSEDVTELWMFENYIYDEHDVLWVVSQLTDENVVIREEKFTTVAGLPCRSLVFAPSMKDHFPVSPVEIWIDQQKELNAIRSNQLIHSDRAQRKLLYNEDVWDQETAKRMAESTEPHSAWPVHGDPNTAAAYLESGNLNADIYQVESRIVNDIQEASGVGDMHMGGSPNVGSRSATEASIIESSLRLRSSDRQDVFERALERVYGGLLNLAQKHLSKDLAIKITDGVWVPMSKGDIQGDFDVVITIGSTMPSDRKGDWDKAVELFKMFGGDVLINQAKLHAYVLSKQGDIKDVTEWLTPPQPVAPPPPPAPVPGAPVPMDGAPLGPPPGGGPPDMAAMTDIAHAGMQGGATPLQQAAAMRGVVAGA